MMKLVDIILNEGVDYIPTKLQEDSNLPAGQGNTDLEGFREELCIDLGLDPTEIQVGKVPDRMKIYDKLRNHPNKIAQFFGEMSLTNLTLTGDVWAKFDISKGTDEIAKILNDADLLDNIVVNGVSGYDLCGIVSDSTQLSGNLVITSKNTEAMLIPVMTHLGMTQNNDHAWQMFDQYWDSIGGKIIGQATVEKMQQRMMQIQGIRQGRQLGGRPTRFLGR